MSHSNSALPALHAQQRLQVSWVRMPSCSVWIAHYNIFCQSSTNFDNMTVYYK
jgi:hypothetical protein